MRAAGYWPSPTAWAAVPPGMETTLTVVLSSGGRSPRWLTSANPGRPAPQWSAREITDERTISDFVAGACCSRRCSYGTWMAGQNFG